MTSHNVPIGTLLLILGLLLSLTACGEDRRPVSPDGDASTMFPDAMPDGAVPGSPGELDVTFGAQGRLALTGSLSAAGLNANGELLVVTNQQLGLLEGGSLRTAEPGYRIVGSVASAPDGRWVIAYIASARNPRAVRLTAALEVDPGFMLEGYSSGFAFAPDGSIYGVGTQENPDRTIFINRFSADGTPDETHTNDPAALEGEDLDPAWIRVASDGSIIVIGNIRFTPFVTRFFADGTWDTSYGIQILGDFGPRYVRDAHLDDSDRLYVLGMSSSTVQVMRLLPSGAVDSTFGQSGLAEVRWTRPLSPDYDEEVEARALALLPDGGVVVSGNYGFDDGEDEVFEEETVFVLKLTDQGAPDSSFGEEGLVRVSLGVEPTMSFTRRNTVIGVDADRLYIVGEYDGNAVIAALHH